jgi:hypothetical protein
MAGRKTHEQQVRTFERKPDYPDGVREDEATKRMMENATTKDVRHPEARQSEFPVSFRGMNQESTHNKHNDSGQQGHKPQKHTDAEEGD